MTCLGLHHSYGIDLSKSPGLWHPNTSSSSTALVLWIPLVLIPHLWLVILGFTLLSSSFCTVYLSHLCFSVATTISGHSPVCGPLFLIVKYEWICSWFMLTKSGQMVCLRMKGLFSRCHWLRQKEMYKEAQVVRMYSKVFLPATLCTIYGTLMIGKSRSKGWR